MRPLQYKNLWIEYEKKFNALLPKSCPVRNGVAAVRTIEKILTRERPEREVWWLLMYALTEHGIIGYSPQGVFQHVMDSIMLSPDHKINICKAVMKGGSPFVEKDLLSPEEYEKLMSKRQETLKAVKAVIETYTFTSVEDSIRKIRELEELSLSLKGLPTARELEKLRGLPPQYRFFPAILSRYAMRWLCTFGVTKPEDFIKEYGLPKRFDNAERQRPYFLGALDLMSLFPDAVSEDIKEQVFKRGRIFPHIEVRKCVYRLGFKRYGASFLNPGMKDKAAAVRRYTQRLLQEKDDRQ